MGGPTEGLGHQVYTVVIEPTTWDIAKIAMTDSVTGFFCSWGSMEFTGVNHVMRCPTDMFVGL